MTVGAKLITSLPIAMIAGWMATRREAPWTPIRLVGLALVLFSLTLLTIARIQYEKKLTDHQGFVSTGIYRRIRHPMYIFSFLAFAGLMLFLDRLWGVLAMMPFGPVLQHLAKREEKELETRYGEDYLRYRRQTWV
jgi:protein-S-isoprenylcysteine O-methyltransferase Ste14